MSTWRVSRRAVLALGVGALTAACTDDSERDDTARLQQRIDRLHRSGGGDFVLPDGELSVSSLRLPSGVALVGGHDTVLVGSRGASVVVIPQGSSDVAVSDLTLRVDEGTHGLEVGVGASRVAVADVKVDGGGGGFGVYVRQDSSEVTLRRCSLNHTATAVRVLEGARSLEIRDCTIDEWGERGISLRSRGGRRMSRAIRLLGNSIGPCIPGGQVRQPIQFNASEGAHFDDVVVRGNTVRGSKTDDKDASGSGTADQISLHHCRRFRVEDNVVEGGGEVGITVSRGSRNGSISGNVCRDNDSAGIVVGSVSGPRVRKVQVTGNRCMGNGADYGGRDRKPARSGIAIRNAANVQVRGNVLDSGQKQDQIYGISVARSESVNFKDNTFRGRSMKSVHRITDPSPADDL